MRSFARNEKCILERLTEMVADTAGVGRDSVEQTWQSEFFISLP
jgi:hypothetical protein